MSEDLNDGDFVPNNIADGVGDSKLQNMFDLSRVSSTYSRLPAKPNIYRRYKNA